MSLLPSPRLISDARAYDLAAVRGPPRQAGRRFAGPRVNLRRAFVNVQLSLPLASAAAAAVCLQGATRFERLARLHRLRDAFRRLAFAQLVSPAFSSFVDASARELSDPSTPCKQAPVLHDQPVLRTECGAFHQVRTACGTRSHRRLETDPRFVPRCDELQSLVPVPGADLSTIRQAYCRPLTARPLASSPIRA